MTVQSFWNVRGVRGALTLTVSPEIALAAPGELYHQGALLPAAFQVPPEGQVVQTLLLHTLKEEREPSLAFHLLDLGFSLLPVDYLGTAQIENGTLAFIGNSFLGGVDRQINGAGCGARLPQS